MLVGQGPIAAYSVIMLFPCATGCLMFIMGYYAIAVCHKLTAAN